MIRAPQRERRGRMEPGEDLVVAGAIGQIGTIELIKAGKEELLRWFSSGYLKELQNQKEEDPERFLEELAGLGATEWEPATEGGILKAVWDLSGTYRAGLVFSLNKIPLRQGTVEICERCGCSPYRLYCGRCLVLAAENGGRIAGFLQEQKIPAAVIGQVTKGPARMVRHGEETGYLERPGEDELFRLLGRRPESLGGQKE